MTNRFMISVAAAALIAGTGFANAQGPGRDAPSAGSVQQSAPAERAAPSAVPMNRDSTPDSKASDKGAKSTQTQQPKGSKNLSAQEDMKPGMKGEKSAQDNMKGEKSKSMRSETQDKGAASKDMKADSKGAADSKSQTTTQAPAGQSPSTTTTGQAGAGAKLSTEQRTQITSVIKEQRVAPVTQVNFSIAVGSRVPRSGVTFHPLPARVVTIYPEWRGYEFILVNEQILVINPRTLEIVAILEA
ncbi:MAG: DUF1236 domain-containing protein [Bradyrhizobium sp.]